jgi:hypothetical protein
MDLGRYLYFTQRLTRREYDEVSEDQRIWGFCPPEDLVGEGFHAKHLHKTTDLTKIRELPFEAVLRQSEAICRNVVDRAGKSLDDLIDECYEWHRQNLEPICTYPPGAKFGRGLYAQQEEKKLVAQYLVAAKALDGSTILGDDEVVIIFEGSSGLYVGLALAKSGRNISVITTNDALVREYRDNPAIARRLRSLCVVGGLADYDPELRRCEHGAVYEQVCEKQLEEALSRRPPATVLVVTVSGLLPEAGPFVAGPTGAIKRAIIKRALYQKPEDRVKKVVFVADYTKHIDRAHGTFGGQIFSSQEWLDLVKEHQDRLHVVTAPPPALRAALLAGQGTRVPKRDLKNISGPIPFTDDDIRYNTAAVALQRLLGGIVVHDDLQSRFSEAYRPMMESGSPTHAQPEREQATGVLRIAMPESNEPFELLFAVDVGAHVFQQAAFSSALNELLRAHGPRVPEYEIDVTRQGNHLCVVGVTFQADARDIWTAILGQSESQPADELAIFARATRTRALDGTVAQRPYSIGFDFVPDDGFDEIIYDEIVKERKEGPAASSGSAAEGVKRPRPPLTRERGE